MTCNCGCNCNCKIKLDDITDPVVRKEITEIQNQVNEAICNHLNMVKVSNTYMTDINYSSEGDWDKKLEIEREEREIADDMLQTQIDNEIEARQVAVEEAFANIQILVDNETTIRAEEDKKLSDRIDNIESGTLEKAEKIIEDSIDKVEEDIREIRRLLDGHVAECDRLWRREQSRAMLVEENLQQQIYDLLPPNS